MIEQGRNAWKQAFAIMVFKTGVVPSYNWHQYANDEVYYEKSKTIIGGIDLSKIVKFSVYPRYVLLYLL